MFDWMSNPEAWLSLATLTALEIVLGIDNLIFLNVVASRVAPEKQASARRIGLFMALGMRVALLASIAWVVQLSEPFVTVLGLGISWRDVILIAGGLFLLAKGTMEIHHTMEGEGEHGAAPVHMTMTAAVIQIMLLDIVFSLDSVITAVGMADDLPVMVTAVVIAMAVMLFAANPVGDFVNRHPTVKMLALSFLLLIGVALVADGLHFHIPKAYLYFAIAFSVLVEALNLFARRATSRRRAARTGASGRAS